MMKQSRGIRNNNPGNIDYNKNNQWRGQIGMAMRLMEMGFDE